MTTMSTRRHLGLSALVVAGVAASAVCLYWFARGMTYQRDYWNGAHFAALFYGGLLGAALATAASVLVRRESRAWLEPFRVAATTLLLLHLGGWVFMSSVTVRTAWHAVARTAVLVGMERNLPPPH